MKLTEQLMSALIAQHEAQIEVKRLVKEIEAKSGGRRQKRKPRKRRLKPKAE